MTKHQTAKWIVDKFDLEDDYPCPICSQWIEYHCGVGECDYKCTEHNILQKH